MHLFCQILRRGLAACLVLGFAVAQAKKGSRTWLDRPWEYSYFIQVDSTDGLISMRKVTRDDLASSNSSGIQFVNAIFDWQDIAVPESPRFLNSDPRSFGILAIRFDKQGKVMSPYAWKPGLTAHINQIDEVILAVGDKDEDLQFDLGTWYTGYSSEEAIYVPAICTLYDLNERYKKGFDSNALGIANFGCREWGYYLQSSDHPYIDVTSYQKRGARILPFIGWGRFDIPPKPVIGKMIDTWVCLYDCPNKEPAGVIPDIQAWARKNGWSVPKAPKKMPLFPDKPHKPGELVD